MTGSHRVEVLGGAGTVCRDGALVAWFAPGFPSAFANQLLEVLRSAQPTDGAAGLAAALEASGAADSVAFGVVVETEGALAVVLRGHVVVSEDGLERLRGTVATGLVAAVLATTSSLTLRGDNDPDQLDRPGSVPFDLRDGAVPGGGVTLWASDRLQPSGPPGRREGGALQPVCPRGATGAVAARLGPRSAIPEAHEPTGTNGPQLGTPSSKTGAATSEAKAIEPTDPAPDAHVAPVPSASAHQHLVSGVNLARGHFNNPRALYCGICGLAMLQTSVVLVDGPRPPLGVLLSDDGTAYSLDGDYILGREPDLAEDVVTGRARPLKVDDRTGRISRVHARVTLPEWDVVITDLGSHNGTMVFNPRGTSWLTLRADQSVVLEPGGRLVIGEATFEFQSIQRH